MTNTENIEVHVATAIDGSQTLVTIYDAGEVTVAFRADQWATWGPPLSCVDMTWGKQRHTLLAE